MVVSHHLQLLYIRSERIDEAKTMFNQLQDIARTREDSFTQSLYQISKAIILKTSKRMKDVVETMRILDNIIDDPIFEYEHKTMALIYLTELKLNEYKVLANSDVLQEIKLLINKIQDFAEDNHSYPLVIKTKLLKIRLQTVQGKFNEVRKMLDASYDFVNYHNLGYLKELIKDEDDYFESNLVKLQSIFNQNKSEIENMELKSIQDYLKSIQSLIR